ncbi:hypothetical protein [Hyphomonas sp.]|uniref:hypothetical protein n=1 Tax=Hyphomonas sp. TaxID=87 RepID=UPI003527D2A1
MDRLRETDPDFAARIRFHKTGTPMPDLTGVSLVVFWLGDPLKEKYPECFAEAAGIANAARAEGIRILNSPEALSNTGKTRQSAVWYQEGVPSARARMVNRSSDLQQVCKDLGGTCIIRSDTEHAQRDVRIVRNEADARRAANECQFPVAVIQLFDIRSEYRAEGTNRSSLFARYHHKARAFVFGEAVMPSHLFFSPNLIVGLSNCLLKRESRPRRQAAHKMGYHRKLLNDMICEDRAYFDSDPVQAQTLSHAVRALGLDFAAVDYCIRPDGSIIIWEANPYFHLPHGEKSVFSAQRKAVERVNKSLDWMAENLRAAAEGRQGTPGLKYVS